VDTETVVTIGFFTFVLPVGWMFASGYYKRWNRHMEQEDKPAPEFLAELEQLRGRVLELEERADFTERLLARERDRDRLPEGG
jgi:hypothetical protein